MRRHQKSDAEIAVSWLVWMAVLIPVGAYFLLKALFKMLVWFIGVLSTLFDWLKRYIESRHSYEKKIDAESTEALIELRKKELVNRLHDLLVCRMIAEQGKTNGVTQEPFADNSECQVPTYPMYNEEENANATEEEFEMTVLRAGKYVFGKNLPCGMFDLFVLDGRGFITVVRHDEDETLVLLEKERGAKEYRGIDSDDVKYFTLDGNIEVRIAKTQMIEIED